MQNPPDRLNRYLAGLDARGRISWAFRQGNRVITTTSFGDKSAVLLHLVTRVKPDATILWVDTGYNTPATYRFSAGLIEDLGLHMKIYSPEMTSVRRNVLMGGIPDINNPLHEEFTRQVKLEPFNRATDTLRPRIWITGIRRTQTTHRQSLDFLTTSRGGILKLAPLLDWQDEDLEDYLKAKRLPNETDYFDPTKVLDTRECGLHTRI